VDEAQPISATERRITLASVMIVFLLSAISQTVVSTAMPRIIADLEGLPLYAWVTTAYLLTSTVMVPIWGKLGDLYGRKPVLLTSIGIFLAGSWLSGLSGEFGDLPLLGGGMTQLIVFRAIQGIGGGGLFTVAFAIIADLYSPRERAQFAGLFGAVFGVANVFGPVIGGFLADHGSTTLFGHPVEGWRWVFYANAPFSVLALFMILTKAPGLKARGTGGRIDLAGAALVIATFVPLLLALTWGGHTWPWSSPQIVGLFAASAVAFTLLLLVERQVADPVVPLHLFRERIFTTSNLGNAMMGAAFMGVASFMPLFMQVGQGMGAAQSGLTMLAMMAGITVSSAINGRLVTMAGVYKPFLVAGSLILLAGVYLMTTIGPDTSMFGVGWRLFLVGVGLGPTQSMFALAIQNAVPMQEIGIATSASQFFRALGNTMGVAIFGVMLTTNLSTQLAQRAPPGVAPVQMQMSDPSAWPCSRTTPPGPTPVRGRRRRRCSGRCARASPRPSSAASGSPSASLPPASWWSC
jgi:MFS family permease